MREGSEGVRTRGGVNLRYWSSGNREVPWRRYHNDRGSRSDVASETWTGYGAWLEWSGFGLFMLAHNHEWDLYDSSWTYGIVGGDLTGGLPSPEIEGTMRGAAVARAGDLSYIADGAVEMTVRLGADPSLDLSIGDWKGYKLTERGEIGYPTDVSIDNFTMMDIPIEADGKFGFYHVQLPGGAEWIEDDISRRTYIPPRLNGVGILTYPPGTKYRIGRGAFYGPAGQEAAGQFDISTRQSYTSFVEDVIVYFGARKPDEPQ